jgi:hypothetical protein
MSSQPSKGAEAPLTKKLLAEAELDKAMLEEIVAKNVWSAPSVQGSWDVTTMTVA